jgi:hypothetical protein
MITTGIAPGTIIGVGRSTTEHVHLYDFSEPVYDSSEPAYDFNKPGMSQSMCGQEEDIAIMNLFYAFTKEQFIFQGHALPVKENIPCSNCVAAYKRRIISNR